MSNVFKDIEELEGKIGEKMTLSEYIGLTDYFDVTDTHPETMRGWLKTYRLGYEHGYQEGRDTGYNEGRYEN